MNGIASLVDKVEAKPTYKEFTPTAYTISCNRDQ